MKAKLVQGPADLRRRVRLRRGDIRTVKLSSGGAPLQAELIIAPFNVVLHLYSRADFARFLNRVRQHLSPTGRFVFDFSVPRPGDLQRNPERRYAAGKVWDSISETELRAYERFEYDPLRQLLVVWTELQRPDGTVIATEPLAHRQIFPQEMMGILETAGFGVVRTWQNFAAPNPGEPLDSLAFECQPAG